MAQNSTIDKKLRNIFILLHKLVNGAELYKQDLLLQEELGDLHERTLGRYLEDINELYGDIVLTEKKNVEYSERKVTVYKAVATKKDKREIIKFFLNNSNDLGWLLQSVHDNDPTILDDQDEKESLKKHLKKDEDVFIFKTNPYEQFESKEKQKIFSTIKNGIKKRAVYNIDYAYPPKPEQIKDAKVLKLVYMNNNWYVAVEDDEDVRFLRLTFIKQLQVGWESKYSKKVLSKYKSFFETIQNPFTLDVPFQTAYLRTSQRVSFYFKENMKPFFPSQEFIKEKEDGTVEFTIDYTQVMEVLPFIKQWQPDLQVISPQSLKEILLADMRESIQLHS